MASDRLSLLRLVPSRERLHRGFDDVRRNVDRLVTRNFALNVLVAAVATSLTKRIGEAGLAEVWLANFAAPFAFLAVRRFVVRLARRRRLGRWKMLSLSALLSLPDWQRFRTAVHVFVRWIRDVLTEQTRAASVHAATAVTASTVVVAGFTAAEAARGEPNTFFGGRDVDRLVAGGFETPNVESPWLVISAPGFEGWTIDEGSVDLVNGYWLAASGDQSLDLSAGSAPGSIFTDLGTKPGAAYMISFAYAGNPDVLGAPGCAPEERVKRMEVFWGGESLGTFSFDTTGRSKSEMGWKRVNIAVVAHDAVTRIRFRSLTPGFCGPVIDDVAVTAKR